MDECPSSPTAAAEYLRMSTEHQQFSFQNQRAAIEKYAKAHGYQVICSYEDPGKSGLALKNRTGLAMLLQDVLAGNQAYKAILVYDVSRWGRFQDSDEAAHYEFLCKRAGIPVIYCAEEFGNDGKMPDVVMKALKRVMAGEYSRELSVKVFEGQKRVFQSGFRMGGPAGYGYRRFLVSENGRQDQVLEYGERKCVASGRIRLVLGPKEEVDCVRDIFKMLVVEKMSIREIVAELNRRGVTDELGAPWRFGSVQGILKNPKYAGIGVWGRTTQILGTPRIKKPEEEWVRNNSITEGIVSQDTFQAAQRVLHSGTWFKSDEDLLSELRSLYRSVGRLSQTIIATSRVAASPQAYVKRFGSLDRAYALIGYRRTRNHGATALRHRLRGLRDRMLMELLETFPDIVITQRQYNEQPSLRLDGNRFSLLICEFIVSTLGQPRWQIRHRDVHPVLLRRCDAHNCDIRDFYLLPGGGMPPTRIVRESDPWLGEWKLGSLLDLRQALAQLCCCSRRTTPDQSASSVVSGGDSNIDITSVNA